jgi:hypothetical protein
MLCDMARVKSVVAHRARVRARARVRLFSLDWVLLKKSLLFRIFNS